MSDGRSAAAAQRVGVGAARVARAWRKLPSERRLAAIAAILLFLSLFLPWYQRQFFVIVSGTPQSRVGLADRMGRVLVRRGGGPARGRRRCSSCCSSGPRAARSTCPAATAA